MTKQQFFIYFLVGLMVFSAIGTGILLLTSSNNTSSRNSGSSLSVDDSSKEDPIPLEDRYLPGGDVTALEVTDLVVGTGAEAQDGDTVTVDYTGWLASDGTIFDSSVSRGQPATFPLTAVIQGWQEGVPGMKVGGKRRLVIPSELAYGPNGAGSIPPNADLVFEVDLLDIPQ